MAEKSKYMTYTHLHILSVSLKLSNTHTHAHLRARIQFLIERDRHAAQEIRKSRGRRRAAHTITGVVDEVARDLQSPARGLGDLGVGLLDGGWNEEDEDDDAVEGDVARMKKGEQTGLTEKFKLMKQ